MFALAVLASIAAQGGAGAARGDSDGETDDVSVQLRKQVFVQRDARTLDRLIEIDFERRGQGLPGPVDDATFARRAFVSIAGRIPSSGELRDFLESVRSDKRADLIDALLASHGYSARMLPFWGDLLRARSNLQNGISGEPFIDRIARFVDGEEGYDEFVHDLLTAEGPVHEGGNGATGHLMRDRGMPEDSMANTMRVFLGTRMECAQCHDHPYDRWTQMDFFRMTAFTGGLSYRAPRPSRESMGVDMGMGAGMEGMSKAEQKALRDVLKGASPIIRGAGVACVRLPKDYAYADGEAGDWVTARAPFGEELEFEAPSAPPDSAGKSSKRSRKREKERRSRPPFDEDVESREAFAAWLTSDENPRFTRVVANRLWKLVMGQGLFEPVDDLKDDTISVHSGLQKRLERLMVDVEYDVREFMRVLYHTKHFARPAVASDALSEDTLIPGPAVRRLSAEQLWDSMLTWVVDDVDQELGRPRQARTQKVHDDYDAVVNLSPQELREMVRFRAMRVTDPDAYKKELRERQVAKKEQDREAQRAVLAEHSDEISALKRKIKLARRKKDKGREQLLREELKTIVRSRGERRRPSDLLRASDLPSPAPDGHFLRQFGQSDREQIVSAHTDASVPQVLALCNGFVEKRVLGYRGAVLMDRLEAAPTTRDEVEEAYLAMLGRVPRPEELRMWEEDLDASGSEAREDLVWTLANSLEFLFLR